MWAGMHYIKGRRWVDKVDIMRVYTNQVSPTAMSYFTLLNIWMRLRMILYGEGSQLKFGVQTECPKFDSQRRISSWLTGRRQDGSQTLSMITGQNRSCTNYFGFICCLSIAALATGTTSFYLYVQAISGSRSKERVAVVLDTTETYQERLTRSLLLWPHDLTIVRSSA